MRKLLFLLVIILLNLTFVNALSLNKINPNSFNIFKYFFPSSTPLICTSPKKGVNVQDYPAIYPADLISTLGVKYAGNYIGFLDSYRNTLNEEGIDQIPQFRASIWREDGECKPKPQPGQVCPREFMKSEQKKRIRDYIKSSYYKRGTYFRIGNEPLKYYDEPSNLKYNMGMDKSVCPNNPNDYWECRKDVLRIYKEMMDFIRYGDDLKPGGGDDLDPEAKFIFGNLEGVNLGKPEGDATESAGDWVKNTEQLWYENITPGHSIYEYIDSWGVHHYFNSRVEGTEWYIDDTEYNSRIELWKRRLTHWKNFITNHTRCNSYYNKYFASKCENQKVWVTEFGELDITIQNRNDCPKNVCPRIGQDDPIIKFIDDSTKFMEQQDWIGGYLFHHFGNVPNFRSTILFENCTQEPGSCQINILGREYQKLPQDDNGNCLYGDKTTTTVYTTKTTTTTQKTEEFIVANFSCSEILEVYECKFSYNNQLTENVIVVFLFADNEGKIVSSASPFAGIGSGETGANLYCSSVTSGTYQVSWKAYRQSDSTLSDELAWSKKNEIKEIVC